MSSYITLKAADVELLARARLLGIEKYKKETRQELEEAARVKLTNSWWNKLWRKTPSETDIKREIYFEYDCLVVALRWERNKLEKLLDAAQAGQDVNVTIDDYQSLILQLER